MKISTPCHSSNWFVLKREVWISVFNSIKTNSWFQKIRKHCENPMIHFFGTPCITSARQAGLSIEIFAWGGGPMEGGLARYAQQNSEVSQISDKCE